MKKIIAIAALLSFGVAHADESKPHIVLYGGIGDSYRTIGNAKPEQFTTGAIGIFGQGGIGVFGVEWSQEGTQYVHEYGHSQFKTASAYNFIIGMKAVEAKGLRIDVNAILGVRDDTSTCPDSYLGYKCYADQEPSSTYKFNYGALVTASYGHLMLGYRYTPISHQIIFGIRF